MNASGVKSRPYLGSFHICTDTAVVVRQLVLAFCEAAVQFNDVGVLCQIEEIGGREENSVLTFLPN